jgi:methylenetetrahydrofolate reductase (NADPH)
MTKVIDLFARRPGATPAADPLPGFLSGFSLEVMPRTAARVADFAAILPQGTRVYVAHIDGTPIDDMVATAKRLREAGMVPMPHLPARSIPSAAAFAEWLARYRGEAGVDQALLLAGGRSEPAGPYHSSMQLLETEFLDRMGFRRLHVAGHPEGNRDVDPDGGERTAMDALAWKQAVSERTGAEMAIATQFLFEAGPALAWARRAP